MKIRIAAFAGEGRIEPLHCISLEIKSGEQGDYLTIVPRARMGSESIAIDSEAMRARGIIVLVKSN